MLVSQRIYWYINHKIHQWWKVLCKRINRSWSNSSPKSGKMRGTERGWKDNICNDQGLLLWSLPNGSIIGVTTTKEAKVNARVGRYHNVTPCSTCNSRKILSCSYYVIFVLSLALKGFISCPMFVRPSQQTQPTHVEASSIVPMLALELCRSLPGLHAFTDFDSDSASSKKGKVTVFESC